MEGLEQSMGCMKIADTRPSDVYEAVRMDIEAILLAHETELTSIFEVDFVWKIMSMSSDVMLYTQFQQAFPNEARLFQFMSQQICSRLPSAELMHMMPLVDEYIENVFKLFHEIGVHVP